MGQCIEYKHDITTGVGVIQFGTFWEKLPISLDHAMPRMEVKCLKSLYILQSPSIYSGIHSLGQKNVIPWIALWLTWVQAEKCPDQTVNKARQVLFRTCQIVSRALKTIHLFD